MDSKKGEPSIVPGELIVPAERDSRSRLKLSRPEIDPDLLVCFSGEQPELAMFERLYFFSTNVSLLKYMNSYANTFYIIAYSNCSMGWPRRMELRGQSTVFNFRGAPTLRKPI